MIINSANLRTLTQGFRANFVSGLALAASQRALISTEIPSVTAENLYPWLQNFSGMREWIGPRQVKNVTTADYRLVNKPFEDTVEVKRTAIEDDQFGVFAPMMTAMGEAASRQPDELVFSALEAGFSSPCYDGQNFFDADHPLINADGSEVSVSNMQAGSGPAWYLLDTSRVMKPLLFQNRQKPRFVAMDNPEDHRVFMNDVFTYGTDSRNAAGYGYWQMAFGSKAELTPANFKLAYDAMIAFKGNKGAKIAVKPTHLVVSSANRAAGEAIVLKMNLAGGESNLDYKRVELVVSPWLG